MKTGMLRIAMAAALMAGSTGALKAEGPANNTLEVRVINNNASVVRVYVQDAKGRLHQLGRVGRADFKIMEVPKAIADMGAFQIRVFPSEPVWSLMGDDHGVRTNALSLKLGDAVNFWVETDMAASKLEVIKA